MQMPCVCSCAYFISQGASWILRKLGKPGKFVCEIYFGIDVYQSNKTLISQELEIRLPNFSKTNDLLINFCIRDM